MAHTVFDLGNTFPTSDWQEGFHWVVGYQSSDTDELLPVAQSWKTHI